MLTSRFPDAAGLASRELVGRLARAHSRRRREGVRRPPYLRYAPGPALGAGLLRCHSPGGRSLSVSVLLGVPDACQ